MKQKQPVPVEGGFPLAAILTLVTSVAALLACIDMPRVRKELAAMTLTPPVVVGVLAAVVTGIILGSLLGLTRRRRVSGVLLGGAVGAVTGLILIPLILAPANLWQCLAGMSLLLITSVAVRFHAR